MMARPSDAHYGLIGPSSFETVRMTIRCFERSPDVYAIAGGWGVYAYEPVVPSVDTDVLMIARPSDRLRRHLAEAGLSPRPGGWLELLEPAMEMWGIGDWDLGLPAPRYDLTDRIEHHRVRRTFRLLEEDVTAWVPDRATLAVTKMVALHNRNLAYRSHSDGVAGMLLGPSLNNHVLGKADTYWLRKAGKDLFDLAALLADPEVLRPTKGLLVENGLASHVGPAVADLHPTVVDFARDLAYRNGRPDPLPGIQRLAGAST